MCDPKILCRQHLLGEWRELYTFVGVLKRKTRIDGYINNNLLEPGSIHKRWCELRKEMIRRGYNPRDCIDIPAIDHLKEEYRSYKIDREISLRDLLNRCEYCKHRCKELYGEMYLP